MRGLGGPRRYRCGSGEAGRIVESVCEREREYQIPLVGRKGRNSFMRPCSSFFMAVRYERLSFLPTQSLHEGMHSAAHWSLRIITSYWSLERSWSTCWSVTHGRRRHPCSDLILTYDDRGGWEAGWLAARHDARITGRASLRTTTLLEWPKAENVILARRERTDGGEFPLREEEFPLPRKIASVRN